MSAGQGSMARSDAKHDGRWVTRTFRLEFTTPAFLGDAHQSGAWRTPPFKHLLREWWRVAWAARNDPADWREMREIEGRLFGHAWLEMDRDRRGREVRARKSSVLLRLGSWATRSKKGEKGWLDHMPRTENVGERGKSVPSGFYLGYGPVQQDRKSIRGGYAIDAEAHAELRLAFCEQAKGVELLAETLSLIQAFGTVGGRGRNGWGSVRLFEGDEPLPLPDASVYARDWRECLRLKEGWPCAVGADESGPLVWTTFPVDGWKGAIEALAHVRKAVNARASREGLRHVLSQPVARLRGASGRMPSSLRFKVRRTADGGFYGVVFHMPYVAPPLMREDRRRVETLWALIHRLLDREARLKRIGG